MKIPRRGTPFPRLLHFRNSTMPSVAQRGTRSASRRNRYSGRRGPFGRVAEAPTPTPRPRIRLVRSTRLDHRRRLSVPPPAQAFASGRFTMNPFSRQPLCRVSLAVGEALLPNPWPRPDAMWTSRSTANRSPGTPYSSVHLECEGRGLHPSGGMKILGTNAAEPLGYGFVRWRQLGSGISHDRRTSLQALPICVMACSLAAMTVKGRLMARLPSTAS